MDCRAFWELIDATRDDVDRLIEILVERGPAEIGSFDAWFYAYYLAISREDLWCAISAIRGGCGDDAFSAARAWLIGRGEATLLAAVRDPESLAAFSRAEIGQEVLQGAAMAAYDRATGTESDIPEALRVKVTIPDLDTWPADRLARLEWTPELYAKTYPALYARFIQKQG